MEEWPTDSIELGPNSRYIPAYSDNVMVGLYEFHRHPDTGNICGGYVAFDVPQRTIGPKWQVLSWEPLTLTPSILCRTCNHHGFIRNGRWEEC